MADTVPGYEANAFFGISAPRNIPPAVLARLNREINAGLRDPKLKARFEDFGADPRPGTPEEITKLIADEVEKWATVVKSGARPSDGGWRSVSSPAQAGDAVLTEGRETPGTGCPLSPGMTAKQW